MTFDYLIILYIIFGIFPSLTWLFYFLSKDLHPEPKKTVVKVFLWGALVTIPVFFVQVGLMKLFSYVNINPLATSIVYWFLIIAFSEEFFKYLVLRFKVLYTPDIDEPLDIMLYIVVGALGFAALENVLYLFNPIAGLSFQGIMQRALLIVLVRFVGATFLHTLCSAFIGYFVAISVYENKHKFWYLTLGISFAVVLHGLFDFSIMNAEGNLKIIIPALILLILAFFVFTGFERLKKMKSISKVYDEKIKT